MPEIHEIEVFVLIDGNGNYAISKDQSELLEAYNEDIGDDLGEIASRIIAVKLKVPAPEEINVTVEVPPLPSDACVSVQ